MKLCHLYDRAFEVLQCPFCQTVTEELTDLLRFKSINSISWGNVSEPPQASVFDDFWVGFYMAFHYPCSAFFYSFNKILAEPQPCVRHYCKHWRYEKQDMMPTLKEPIQKREWCNVFLFSYIFLFISLIMISTLLAFSISYRNPVIFTWIFLLFDQNF